MTELVIHKVYTVFIHLETLTIMYKKEWLQHNIVSFTTIDL